MKRAKLFGLVVAAILIIGLAAWLFDRAGADEAAGGDREVVSADEAPAPSSRSSRRASERPDPAREAKAAITGTVRDLDDAPIAGAQVCAWPRVSDLDGTPPGKPRCTKSEADGHYRLDGLFPVRVIVNAEARGYLPQRWFAHHESYREELLQLAAAQTREGVDFVLRSGGVAIEGVVRDIGGGVVEGAFVWVGVNGFEESGRSASISDAEGRFSLWTGPGRVIVHAEAEGYADGRRHSIAPGATLEVVLTPESVINGRVVLAGTGEPVAGVVIEAEVEVWGSDAGGSARSDDAGNFRIDKLEPGVYTLGARGDELYGEAPELVHLGLAQTSDGVVIEVHPAYVVSGELVIAGGTQPRPCPQGYVRLSDRADKRNSRTGRVTGGGEVEIRTLLPGTYEVDVRCAGTVSELEYADIELRDAGVSGLRWEVHEGLAIRGEVVDAAGEPVAGMQVFASMKGDPDDPRKQMTQDISDATLDDGRFAAVGLLPGTYEVRLFSLEGARDSDPVTVELAPGADVNDVRIELRGEGTIRGSIREADGQPVAGVSIMARGLEKRLSAGALSNDEGGFEILHVPVGEYRVVATDEMAQMRAPGTSDDDEQGVVVRVAAGETAEIELIVESRKATIRGRVLDEHGSPVADAFVSHRRVSDSASAAKGGSSWSMRWGFEERPVLTDVDGSFVIDGLVADGSYVIGAFRKGGGEAISEGVSPGEVVELTIVDTGALAGKVVMADGSPAPDRFKLTLNEAEGFHRSDELFRTGGAFRMQELPPGSYTLVVDSPVGVARIEGIELGPGEVKTDFVVTLDARVTVRGRLVDIDTREPVPGMTVSIGARGTSITFGMEKGNEPHVSDAEGRFEVADAVAGKVTLAVSPRNFGEDTRYSWLWTNFFIPTGDSVVDIGDVELVADRVRSDEKSGDTGFEVAQAELEAEPEDYVASVSLIRPGGPADGTGLEVGDRIETVDGHDVRGLNSFRFHKLTRVPPGESFELGVAGGKTVKITAGPAIK